MDNNMMELTPEQLEQIKGGYVIRDDANQKFWIVRKDGSVIAPAPDEESAVRFAKTFNTSPDVLTLDEYKDRFGKDLAW